jgi:hypothetical protein
MFQLKAYFSRIRGKKLRFVIPTFLLIFFLGACSSAVSLPTATANPDMVAWKETESPLFPTSWPPTKETVWVSYTFAYGSNPATLMDGAYVTRPLSKTEWEDGKSTTTILTNEMKQVSIQGIVPLDDQSSKVLENGPQVFEYCLKMRELPDLDMPETKDMLAFYQDWFKYNGAFLNLIRDDHADFVDWVTSND